MLTSFEKESSEKTAEKWVAESGATYYMTRSADMIRDVQPTNDQVGVDESRMIDMVGYLCSFCCIPREPDG